MKRSRDDVVKDAEIKVLGAGASKHKIRRLSTTSAKPKTPSRTGSGFPHTQKVNIFKSFVLIYPFIDFILLHFSITVSTLCNDRAIQNNCNFKWLQNLKIMKEE